MKYKLVEKGDVIDLVLRGSIDEGAAAALQELDKAVKGSRLVIDCDLIEYINSFGARSWSLQMAKWQQRLQVELTKCPIVFVEYANLLYQFIGNATVRSFYAPYLCASCRHRSNRLIDSAEIQSVRDAGALLACACEKCGGKSLPETDPSDFVDFLTRS